jgi:hypothetical protein
MAEPLPDSPNPNPDFPVGAAARVRPVGRMAKPAKGNLVGRVGTVVRSSRATILLEFPGEKFREHFAPRELERITTPENA